MSSRLDASLGGNPRDCSRKAHRKPEPDFGHRARTRSSLDLINFHGSWPCLAARAPIPIPVKFIDPRIREGPPEGSKAGFAPTLIRGKAVLKTRPTPHEPPPDQNPGSGVRWRTLWRKPPPRMPEAPFGSITVIGGRAGK